MSKRQPVSLANPSPAPSVGQQATHQPAVTDLKDWISLAECASRLPSPVPGKRTASITVLRLARKHGLTVLRRGRYRFVYWPDVLGTFQPEQVKQPRPPRFSGGARRTLAQAEWTRKKLEELGVA